MRRLIVLRPEPGASPTVERARALGLEAISLPLFRIEPIDWRAPDAGAFDALLLTSANAARQAGSQLTRLSGLPVYAVGEATAEAARETGLDVAAAGPGRVDDLLAGMPPELRLLHLCGEDRRVPTSPAQEIVTVPVYRAVPLPASPAGFHGAVLAVHSPRAGQRLEEITPAAVRPTIRVAAISAAAAAAVGEGWESVESAPMPNDPALLALAARLCDK